MRSPGPRSPTADPHSTVAAVSGGGGGGGGARDAEALFRVKKIPEIRTVEAATRREIEVKEEELRQLVGRSYRDLIDSADSILLIKTSSEAISSNLAAVGAALASLSADDAGAGQKEARLTPDPARARLYGTASRVKYLVDTPENIWGCLDESMLLEASGRYLRAREVHGLLAARPGSDLDILDRFPLLRHQWEIVEGFKAQISQRSRERLLDPGLTVASYADALAAAATIDDLDPKQVLRLFLDSRRSWISQKLASNPSDPDSCFSALCEVVRTIRVSLGQVGELFLLASNEMPLFYKVVLGSPPGTQLFGGIPNPEEEVKLWKLHRESLEAVMVLLEPESVAHTCSAWLEGCCSEIFGELSSGRKLIDAIASGEGLGSAEKLVREVLDSREGLEESLEQWLRSGFGSDIESPWNQIRDLVLKEGKDILDNRLEEAFVDRMKKIMLSEFENLSTIINVRNSIAGAITPDMNPKDRYDLQAYLKKASTGGGVWFSESKQKKAGILANLKSTMDENDFQSCLNLYFGPEVSRIRDALDGKCRSILEDLLSFVEANNSTLRLKELVPFVQEKCYQTISFILNELEVELGKLFASLESCKEDDNFLVPSLIVERSLFVGRLLFALRYHSSHIPVILGSPRRWAKETGSTALANLSSPLSRQSRGNSESPLSFTPRRHTFDNSRSPHAQFVDSPRRQTVAAAAALFGADDISHPKLDELNRTLQKLCIRAHSLWITWVCSELSVVLSEVVNKDDALSSSTPLQGWDVTVIKEQESSEGPLEIQIALPSMPSIYIISFLYQASLEVHRVGGHILEKTILQNFARELQEKVIGIYENLLMMMEAGKSHVSEKGVLQILLDLRFVADVLSGGTSSASSISESITKQETTQSTVPKPPFRRKRLQIQPDSAGIEPAMKLINKLSQRLDPIDWATYQPYLWENEKQSYKRHAVLFGFFVQLRRLYTDAVQKLPTKSNTDSNIIRCSQVPRFKYLPISAPALTSRGTQKSSLQLSADDSLPRSPWKGYSNGESSMKAEFDDGRSFGAAAPLLKSFMTQVGSKFGESTSRWGSMLSDGQVGKFKDRSAAAMSTFGDILPGPAAGLLSSLTSGGRFDS